MKYRFLEACRGNEVDCTPIWLMRQAGRYMKDYREIKEKYSFMEMCKNPELAAEITLQPIKKFDLDAAIIFSDILVVPEAMGIEVRFVKGDGPQIQNPVREEKDIKSLKEVVPEEDTSFVLEAIRLVRKEIEGRIPLIGFSGAPFTLASYMVEGGHSRHYLRVKNLMYGNPQLFGQLMEKVSRGVVSYLKAQASAGVQAVQIFDSWVGALSPSDYRDYVLPHTRKCIKEFKESFPEVPVIHFSTGTSGFLELIARAGGDVIGVDWRINIGEAWKRIGERAIQGNLDPVVLTASKEVVEQGVKEILRDAGGKRGHIFNLGHGVLPQTPEDNVAFLVDKVHEFSRKTRSFN